MSPAPTTTPATTPPAGGGTDWTKLISQTITGAAGAVTAYEGQKAAQIAKETEAKKKVVPVPGAYPPPQEGTSPVLIAGVIGVGVIAIGAVLMVAARKT